MNSSNLDRYSDVSSILVVDYSSPSLEVKISFIVPTFRRPDTIIEAIDSIYSTLSVHKIPFEVIVIDNSAEFKSENKSLQYFRLKRYDQLKYYINERNIGMEGNWNRGIELARGTYISFVHDDDLLAPNYSLVIDNCIKSFKTTERIGFIKAKHCFFSDSRRLPVPKTANCLLVRKTLFEAVLTGNGPAATPTCGILFTKKALLEVGGFNPDYYPSADSAIGVEILKKGYKGFETCEEIGFYRIGMNESLKLSTIQAFVSTKSIVRRNWYSLVWYGFIISLLFEPYHYSASIDFWIAYAKSKFNLDISVSQLDCLNRYKKHRIRELLFRVIYKLFKVVWY